MIPIEQLSIVIRSIVISKPSATTIENLQKEFRESEGFNIPLYEYSSVQDLLMNGLNKAVKVYGHGPKAIVEAQLNSKTQHIQNLVNEQKPTRARKRPPKGKRPQSSRYANNDATHAQYSRNSGNSQQMPFRNYNGQHGNSILGNPAPWQVSARMQAWIAANNANTWQQTQNYAIQQIPRYQNTYKMKTANNYSKAEYLYNKQAAKHPSQSLNNGMRSPKLSVNISSNNSSNESPVKFNGFRIIQSFENSNDAHKENVVNIETLSPDSSNIDYNNNRDQLLGKLREFQAEILNNSLESKNEVHLKSINQSNENWKKCSDSSLENLQEPTASKNQSRNEKEACNSKFSKNSTSSNENEHSDKDPDGLENKDATGLENLGLNRKTTLAINGNPFIDANTSLPSLIFSVSEFSDITLQDLDEAVPDYAINNLVFSLDFPEHTVTFGSKIEPFRMPDDLQVDSIISIYIADIHNPFRFWFHYAIDELDELMFNIELFYARDDVACAYKMLPEQMQCGQICVALYNDAWHRAEIVSNIIDNKIRVYYLDYGTVGDVALDELLYLNVEFAKQPAFACRGALAELSPVLMHWSTEATLAFVALVKNRKLHAKIAEIDKENRVYYLQVADTHNDNKIHINRELIKMKHALQCHDWMKSKMTGKPRLRHKREDYPTFDMLENGDYPTLHEICTLEISGINYEHITDKKIYHPSIINKSNLNDLPFLLLSNNPFKEDIEKQISSPKIEEIESNIHVLNDSN